jgi:hypothetical protein
VRYAILFSGMSFRRHVNGLEFCYRTLIDRLGYSPPDIHVMNYDGSLRAFGDSEGEPIPMWAGDGTPHRMIVNAEGSRSAFQYALQGIGSKLKEDDQLFIHTSGHGAHPGGEHAPDLLAFPYGERYNCADFCTDLRTLPRHRALVVVLTQCYSGGFKRAILEASQATATFVATAAAATSRSFMSFEDDHWDAFQRGWFEAFAGPDTTLREAFEYASTGPGSNPYDSPEYAAHPDAAGNLTLR